MFYNVLFQTIQLNMSFFGRMFIFKTDETYHTVQMLTHTFNIEEEYLILWVALMQLNTIEVARKKGYTG